MRTYIGGVLVFPLALCTLYSSYIHAVVPLLLLGATFYPFLIKKKFVFRGNEYAVLVRLQFMNLMFLFTIFFSFRKGIPKVKMH